MDRTPGPPGPRRPHPPPAPPRPRHQFVTTAGRFLSDLNAIHPFREGNGRTQRVFLQLLANQAGWQLAWACITPAENNTASARAMSDRNACRPLLDQIVLAGDVGIPPFRGGMVYEE